MQYKFLLKMKPRQSFTNIHLAISEKHLALSTVLLVLVISVMVIAAAGVLIYTVTHLQAQNLSSSSKTEDQETIAQTTNSTLGLEFSLSINTTIINYGNSISITMELQNVFSTLNSVNASFDWTPSILSVQPCRYFDNYVVFTGDYDIANLSLVGEPLIVSGIPPPSCPAFDLQQLLIQPHSTNATAIPSYLDAQLALELSSSINGYYSKIAVDDDQYTLFPVGVYTILAGDEWGQSVLLHFEVVQPG